MSEKGRTGYADLCVVTAVDIEFAVAARLLTDENLWGRLPTCPTNLPAVGQVTNLPHEFSEEARMKICRGRFGRRRITVLQSGMGARGFDRRLAEHLAANRYDALIVAGLAGGLNPKLRAGDAVLYDLCYGARADRDEVASVGADDGWSKLLFEALRASGRPCVRGSGVTVNEMITEAEDKLALGARYGAAAVDMETFEVLNVCARFDLPAAALRVILDEAGHDTPDFNRAYEPNGLVNAWRMAGAMMARPVAASRFLLNVRPALRTLRENLKVAFCA
jgi:nucleoside phosphorylase